jgi:DNA-binding transcriptional regulator YiaG
LRAGRAEQQLEVAGVHFTAKVQAKVCRRCKERHVDRPELERLELHAAQWLADDGARSGEAFRFMRKAIGLRALELAELLDLTPETISRWENDKQPADARSIALLGAMISDRIAGRRDTLARLEAMRSPSKTPNDVRLKLP